LSGCTAIQGFGFGGHSEDAKIRADVIASLYGRAELGPANQLTVQTRNHVVYLYGTVASELQREKAESVAMEAQGVDIVVNFMSVSQ
jgi:osmotically-inducible protein OsmY